MTDLQTAEGLLKESGQNQSLQEEGVWAIAQGSFLADISKHLVIDLSLSKEVVEDL